MNTYVINYTQEMRNAPECGLFAVSDATHALYVADMCS